jgi:transcriptional antiterminator RfaH
LALFYLMNYLEEYIGTTEAFPILARTVLPVVQIETEEEQLWYCVRSGQKKEHIAAANVRAMENVRVMCPRIRFRQVVQGQSRWVTEALFPGYFFARFPFQEMLVSVRSAHGVTKIVRFGQYYPLIPNQVIEELQDLTTTGDLLPALVVGSSVTIARGTLAGSEAVITEVLPAKERVRLLLNFLGRETVVEADMDTLLPEETCALRFAARFELIGKKGKNETP